MDANAIHNMSSVIESYVPKKNNENKNKDSGIKIIKKPLSNRELLARHGKNKVAINAETNTETNTEIDTTINFNTETSVTDTIGVDLDETLDQESPIRVVEMRQVDVEKLVDKIDSIHITNGSMAKGHSACDTLSDYDDANDSGDSSDLSDSVGIPTNISGITIPSIVRISTPTSPKRVGFNNIARQVLSAELPEVEDIKPTLIEKNGEGIQIRDEEQLEKLSDEEEGIDKDLLILLLDLSRRVYQEMGPGHTENIYHKALAIELRNHNIHYETEKRVLITYHDRQNNRKYTLGEERIDLFLLDYNLIIELKAVTTEPREPELAQIRKYYRELLKSEYRLDSWGLIINFPQPAPSKKARNDVDFVMVRL